MPANIPSFPGAQRLADQFPKQPLPDSLQGFGDLAGGLSGYNGYSLSYQGGDKDRLMGNDAYQYGDFPEWMQRKAPVGGLKQMQGQLPGLFDTAGIQNSWDALSAQQMGAAKGAAGSAARAASNRAMLSGGRVGAGFAGASAMLPFMRQQAQQQLDVEGLKSQLRTNQANLGSQLAQNIAGLRDARQGRQTNYAIEAARLAQKRVGVSGEAGGGASNRGGQLNYGQQGGGEMFPSTPGYVPNAGGVQFASVNGRQLPGHVIMPGALSAMGYQM